MSLSINNTPGFNSSLIQTPLESLENPEPASSLSSQPELVTPGVIVNCKRKTGTEKYTTVNAETYHEDDSVHSNEEIEHPTDVIEAVFKGLFKAQPELPAPLVDLVLNYTCNPTDEIVKILKDKQQRSKATMKFAESVTVLNLGAFRMAGLNQCTQQLTRTFENVKSLKMPRIDSLDNRCHFDYSLVGKFKQLRSIDFTDCVFAIHSCLGYIAILRDIEHLNAGNYDFAVTDCLATFPSMRKIKKLCLNGSPISDKMLEKICNSLHLEKLHLSGCNNVTAEAIDRIGKNKPSLTITMITDES